MLSRSLPLVNFTVVAFLFAIFLLPVAAVADEPFRLGDVRPSPIYSKSTIAVVPFEIRDAPIETEAFPRVIRNDLELSGFFRMPADQRQANRLNLRDNTSGTIHYNEWAELGVEHYLMGRVTLEGNHWSVRVLMYDIPSRRLILNRTFNAPKERIRYLAHTISDAVIKQLKGYEGVCRTKIVFVTEQIPGVKEAAIMDYDGFNAHPVTNFGHIVTMPTWGMNGTEIYFTSYHGNRANIYGLTLREDARQRLVGGDMWTIAAYGGTNHSPAWSPAAGRIVMVLSKDGNSEIYTSDRLGRDLRRVTQTPHTEGSPSWSPDGRRIAFTSNEGGGVHIYSVNADGSNRRRLTSQGTWSDGVSWAPDAQRVAFAYRSGGQSDIYICDVSGGRETYRRLTMGQGNNESPTWAPNGRHLAFASDRTGTWQIYIMLDDGQNQRQITTSGRNILPNWGPIPSPLD